jgi:hypothetical protein
MARPAPRGSNPEQNRREENHQAWEDKDPVGAIKAKGAEARRQGVEKANREKAEQRRASRRQRNNRREY